MDQSIFSQQSDDTVLAKTTVGREVWIDYVKVIGIILVIFGHIDLIRHSTTTFIYAFHIPLFFLISGYLYKNKDSFKKVITKDVKRLVLPYTYFYLISYFYWFAVIYVRHRDKYPGTLVHAGIIKPLMGLLLGVGYETHISISINHPLWFLVALFFVKAIYTCLEKLTKASKLYIAAAIMILLTIVVVLKISGYDLWFSLDSAVLALPFFFFGVLLKSAGKLKLWFKNNYINLAYFVLFAFFTWLLVQYNGRADINGTMWGRNLFLFYIAGLTGTFMVFAISFILSTWVNKLALFISLNTLILMCILGILRSITTSVLKIAHYNLPLNLSFIQATVVTLVMLVLSLPLLYVIDKYLPFLTGAGKKDKTSAKNNRLNYI